MFVELEGIEDVLIAVEVLDEGFGLCVGLFSILSTVSGEDETFDVDTLLADGVVVVRSASLSNEPVGPLSSGFFVEYWADGCLLDEDDEVRWWEDWDWLRCELDEES